jgi:hypothetical protein
MILIPEEPNHDGITVTLYLIFRKLWKNYGKSSHQGEWEETNDLCSIPGKVKYFLQHVQDVSGTSKTHSVSLSLIPSASLNLE